jgi:hypothetical protein
MAKFDNYKEIAESTDRGGHAVYRRMGLAPEKGGNRRNKPNVKMKQS